MLWPWKMPLVASPHAFWGGRECRLETSVPKVDILKPKQEVRGKGGLGAVPKAKLGLALPKSLSLSLALLSLSLSLSLSLARWRRERCPS